ncbi:hypothetical protein SCA6_018499 [Theobroma cacao]
MTVSVLGSTHDSSTKNRSKVILLVSIISSTIILGLVSCIIWKKSKKRDGLLHLTRAESGKEEAEVPLFDFSSIENATNNFCYANVIGGGGFGPVYKGNLPTGQEIAVKRLSKDSGQGIEQFSNEVGLIAKLQHRNLVGLLGCCIQGDERMLIYEFMSNSSLDHFIFGLRLLTFYLLSVELISDALYLRNRGYSHPDHRHNLLGHAWLLWNEDRALELIDTSLEESCVKPEVVRCIQVGLLCVQEFPEDRPAMSSVLLMLTNESAATLPQPKPPGFFIQRKSSTNFSGTTTTKEESMTGNAVTITVLEAR